MASVPLLLVVMTLLHWLGMTHVEDDPRTFLQSFEWATETLTTTGYGASVASTVDELAESAVETVVIEHDEERARRLVEHGHRVLWKASTWWAMPSINGSSSRPTSPAPAL